MQKRQQQPRAGRRTVRRAPFQPDVSQSENYGQQTESAQTEREWIWHTEEELTATGSQDPWQAPFVPVEQGWIYEDAPGYPQAEPGYMAQPQAQPYTPQTETPAKKKGLGLSLLAILASLSIVLICLYQIYQAYQQQPVFLQKLKAMQGKAFFEGVMIDGQPVGGLNPAQLRAQHQADPQAGTPQLNISLLIDQVAYRFDSSHIPFSKNFEAVMEEAWSIGRQGSPSQINSAYTPFETRWRHVRHIKQTGAFFYTALSYDSKLLDALAGTLVSQINREPVNAVVSTFDFNTKQFTVTQDVKGRQLAASTVSQALRKALDSKDYQAVISLQSTPLLPRVSSVDLQNSFAQLSTFSTKTSSDQDRNNNIALAAQAISNKTLMPGEVFSFNETTGQRTPEKGYRGAPAIKGGVLIDDVGGGVCQVSSTLFCAAATAGMSIVERSPHAWPVSYLDKGMDATVNWPNLDFKFKNDKDTPVFIIATYNKRNLTIEFYGMRSAPGESIRLETQLMSTTQPPREPIMQANPNLPPNTQQELKKARTGYVVDTYRVYLRNGSEVRREKLFTSRYKEVQQVIEYN